MPYFSTIYKKVEKIEIIASLLFYITERLLKASNLTKWQAQ